MLCTIYPLALFCSKLAYCMQIPFTITLPIISEYFFAVSVGLVDSLEKHSESWL